LSSAAMKELSPSAIYVNASDAHLLAASCGESPSRPLPERKRWVTGYERFQEAKRLGQDLPLIFATYAELTFWALATDIEVGDKGTTYRFSNLSPIKGHRRSDLVLENTGARLADSFIRSYALVRTPKFLVPRPSGKPLESQPAELIGLEGEGLQRMVTHRRREAKLRDMKIATALSQGNGHLVCEVPGCGFDFQNVYGEVGTGYAQVHHLRPLSEYKGEEETRLADLVIVCANCHTMIHRGGKSRELRSLIRLPDQQAL